MTNLTKRVTIECPLGQAENRLRAFFRAHGNADGDIARLALSANIAPPGAPAVTVQKSVIATMQPHHVPGDMSPRYRVQWAPEGTGPFPLFSGELTVGGTDVYATFDLVLKGSYTPPLGIAGLAFDAVAGHSIAERTALNLLGEVKTFVESAFNDDELVKEKHRAGSPQTG